MIIVLFSKNLKISDEKAHLFPLFLFALKMYEYLQQQLSENTQGNFCLTDFENYLLCLIVPMEQKQNQQIPYHTIFIEFLRSGY